jgi:pre-mRNA-splicing factor SYF1
MSSEEYSRLKGLFPLTQPIPTYVSHPELLEPQHLSTEHDLLRNPTSLPRWQSYLSTIVEQVEQTLLSQRSQSQSTGSSSIDRLLLGDKLSTEKGRQSLQKITDVYERALQHHPYSFTLWRDYLKLRSSFVLGNSSKPLKLGQPRKNRGQDGIGRTMTEWLLQGKGEIDELEPGEIDYESHWTSSLDPIIGYEEWKSLASLHERALRWLPFMPRIWLSYLTLFLHPNCPSPLKNSHARRTFDRALRTLPPSLHERVWHLYLTYANPTSSGSGGISFTSIVSIWRRYLLQDSNPTLYYINEVLIPSDLDPEDEEQDQEELKIRCLEAAKRLLILTHETQSGNLKNSDGKSPYQLLGDFLKLCERFPEQIGIDRETSEKLSLQREKAATVATTTQVQVKGKVVEPLTPLDSTILDPTCPELIDVEEIIRTQGLKQYPDQAGKLWTGLATYWLKRGEFDQARLTFEQGLQTVVTLRDFTQVFDSFAESEESYISGLMESVQSDDADESDEEELDERMKKFEELMDRRPFLVNEVLLRRNPNDVQEWEKRVALYGNDDEKARELSLSSSTRDYLTTDSLSTIYLGSRNLYFGN